MKWILPSLMPFFHVENSSDDEIITESKVKIKQANEVKTFILGEELHEMLCFDHVFYILQVYLRERGTT